MHTYMPTYIHTYIRMYVHTYIRTYVRTYVRTYIHTYVHTYICTYIHTYIHTYVHRHARTQAHRHPRTHARTHARTRTHTYIYSSALIKQILKFSSNMARQAESMYNAYTEVGLTWICLSNRVNIPTCGLSLNPSITHAVYAVQYFRKGGFLDW